MWKFRSKFYRENYVRIAICSTDFVPLVVDNGINGNGIDTRSIPLINTSMFSGSNLHTILYPTDCQIVQCTIRQSVDNFLLNL